jgi:TolB-like protein/class 3 adenylate cyclase/Tfp pilus assembly protein PilF
MGIAGHRSTIVLYRHSIPLEWGGILSGEHVERRLAAILAADVAGSCRLIGLDEEGTLARLKALRKTLFDPKIAEHHGRVVKNTGDGALVEFASVVHVVRCADEIQRGVAEQNVDVPQDRRIEFRIGIHVGDIIIEEDDIFGDGVNIAVRLEEIAEPGGVSISDDAHRQIRGKIGIDYDDMGPRVLKNIVEPMRVWRVRLNGLAAPPVPNRRSVGDTELLALPDRPSIAVLPFENMSGDPEQEYFADGIVDDITTALSRFKVLFVIARNSSFVYKGKAVDIKQIGRELGVRYLLEGSVRKEGNRVRITGQLIDSITGSHLWADRFEGELADLFGLQDKVTESVVGAIAPELQQAEIQRARRKPTESLDAYDFFLRGMAREVADLAGGLEQPTSDGTSEALRLFCSAIELDPEFASAHGLAALCYAQRKAFGWMIEREREIADAARLARRAIQVGKDDAVALATGGYVLAFVVHDLDTGVAGIERALKLNPNFAAAWLFLGWTKVWLGQPDVAIEHLEQAMRLSPLGRGIAGMQAAAATAHFFAGRYDEASAWAERMLREYPASHPGLRIAAASNAMAGRPEQAHKAAARLRQLDPALRVSNLKDVLGPYRRAEDPSRYEEGMRQAGVPE